MALVFKANSFLQNSHMATFVIATRTGSIDHGGTDFDVHAHVKYSNGSFSEWENLDNRGDDWSKDQAL